MRSTWLAFLLLVRLSAQRCWDAQTSQENVVQQAGDVPDGCLDLCLGESCLAGPPVGTEHCSPFVGPFLNGSCGDQILAHNALHCGSRAKPSNPRDESVTEGGRTVGEAPSWSKTE